MADITASASPHAVQLVSAGLIHALTPVVTGQKHSGLLELDWDIALHLTVTPGKSSVTLNDPAAGKPGTIGVVAVDVHWDKLAVSLGVNLPAITIGGFCIIPNPWGGCLVRAPEITIFGGDPDLTIPLDLSGWLVSTLSFEAAPKISPLTHGSQGYEAIYLDPTWVDLELVNIAESVSNLIDLIIQAALAPLPSWARDAIETVIGPLDQWIATQLGIAQDVDQWLWNTLKIAGLWDAITTLIADQLLRDVPLVKVPNPVTIKGESGVLQPIVIPIADMSATVTAAALLLSADLGGP